MEKSTTSDLARLNIVQLTWNQNFNTEAGMSDFDFFNTDAIPNFNIVFDGIGAMHPNYRKYSTQQTAIAHAVSRFTEALPLALWRSGIHFQKHVRLDLVPFDRKKEAEKRYYQETNQNHFSQRVFYDESSMKVPNRLAKCRALASIIDSEWEKMASEIGSTAISIGHVCDDIVSDDWAASGRITDFHVNRKRDKAVALLFEASHKGIVLSLAIIKKTMTWTKLPVYKQRTVSTGPLYCYGTKITWPTADTIRVKGRFNAPDLIVPVNGYEIDFSEYEKAHVRSEEYGGGLFYYGNSNSPIVIAQSEHVSKNVIRGADEITLSTFASLPSREARLPQFLADQLSQYLLQ